MPSLEDEFRHRLKRAVYALTEISTPRATDVSAAPGKTEQPKPAEELVAIAVSALRDLKVDRRTYTVLTKRQHDRNTYKLVEMEKFLRDLVDPVSKQWLTRGHVFARAHDLLELMHDRDPDGRTLKLAE